MSMTCKQCRNICDCEDDAWRKGVDFDPDVSVKYCTAFVPETNADRIRAMSDEELAQYLTSVESRRRGDGCGAIWGLPYVALEWLKQPAEVDNG